MRDPKRIPELLKLIQEIWECDQDLRFLQLVYILQSKYDAQNGSNGKVEEVEKDGFKRIGYDLFNVEDSGFKEFLKEYLEELKKREP